MRACPACKEKNNLAYLWNTQIVRCSNCRLAYVDKLPSLEELREIYSTGYYSGHGDHTAYTDYVADKRGFQANFRHRIAALRRFSQGGDLFEAGCAHGFFLELAQPYWNVQGIDVSAEAVTYARDVLGLPVMQGDFESNPPPPRSIDVAVMWDTIEHLYDPVLAIRKSAEALRPGGILALTTGNLDALLPCLQRRSWRLMIPEHLYYFSRASITWLLKAHGLTVVHFSHVGFYRSLRQMAGAITWKHRRVGWRRALVERLERLPGMDLQIPLNLYDIMFVIARLDGRQQSDGRKESQ